MKEKIQKYLDIVIRDMEATGEVTDADIQKIKCGLGLIDRKLQHGVCVKVPGRLEEFDDVRDAIICATEKDTDFIRADYYRKKAMAGSLEDFLHKIIELRIDALRLMATGIDRYGNIDQLHEALYVAGENIFRTSSDPDLAYLDAMLWSWREKAGTFSGLPEKCIDEIRKSRMND